jgi:hypothetical protein
MAVPQQARGARASLRRIGKWRRKVKVWLPCTRKEAAMERIWRWGMAAATVAALLGAGAAEAHWRGGGGVYFGVAPPLYSSPYPSYRPDYAPPAYYAPPAATEGCYAGAYVCPLEGPAAVGMPCSCPTSRGQAWGRAR